MKTINLQSKNSHWLLCIICILCFDILSLGQTSRSRQSFSRNSIWTETVFNGSMHKHFKWQFDYQNRRMSDASEVNNGSANPFKYSYQHVYRPWVHFQLNENVRFSISPIGFWETWSPASENGGSRKIQPEYRICPQLTLMNKIGRIAIDQRYRYEFRAIGNKVTDISNSDFDYGKGMDFPNANKKMRLRYFLRATVPLGNHKTLENKTLYLVAWNELFLSLGKNIYNDKLWDQNRTFCLLGYKPGIKLPMRFEIGYGLQTANRTSSSIINGNLTETSSKVEQNNILQVYIIFEDFNKLFKSSL